MCKISKGRLVESENGSTNLPLGIEYERLMKNLKQRTYDKYDIKLDLRNKSDLYFLNKNNVIRNIIISPGMMIEHETNMFAPYPQENPEFMSGTSWIGGLYE